MSNNFYTHGSFPSTGAAATSASMRAELDLITAGFDKLPTLTANANKFVVVNSGGTALTVTSTLPTATVSDTTFTVQNTTDNTKTFQFLASSITAGTLRIYTMPDASTTLVGIGVTQTLTNKTLTAPVIATIVNTGTLTLPTSTDTLVGRATTDTLTNKTLTAPVIASIVNTGTLTLPTSTDTLVGRATTDTLTNKTLTAPVIATIVNTGTLTLPTSTDTLVGRATTDTLTNKTLTSPAISGGTIDNASVGATTASTGAFTTLSATGVATFSAGTAALPAITTTGDTNTGIFFPAADTVGVSTGGSERLRVDSSGNVGIGVTPSAWALSGQKVLQVLNASLNGYTTDEATVAGNAYHNGSGWRYIATNFAEQYSMSGGGHQWYTAPSGTAGNAITFTERMRIDSSGKVGIGTTSLGSKLNIAGTTAGSAPYITFTSAFATASYFGVATQSNDIVTGDVLGDLVIDSGNNLLVTTNGNNLRLKIDTSGNVGIGTSSPTSGLQTAGSSSKSAFKTPNIAEVNTISATAATGTINYDVTTQSVLYYTTNASGNFTVNFRGSSGTTLNTVMQTGESISATFLVTNGATAYYNSVVQVDGSTVTPKWQGGTAPTSGNASSIDSYTYVIIKTGSAAFTVLASVTKFA